MLLNKGTLVLIKKNKSQWNCILMVKQREKEDQSQTEKQYNHELYLNYIYHVLAIKQTTLW